MPKRRDVEIDQLPLGPLQANCYILKHPRTRIALVIDPGSEASQIVQALGDYRVEGILLTHAHYDHIGAVESLCRATSAPVFIHEAEAEWLTEPTLNGSLSPWSVEGPVRCSPADELLRHGDTIPFADIELRVAHTPGHSPGGTSYIAPGFAFTGDALFRGSIGRTDFPYGDLDLLLDGIRRHLLTLPDDTLVLPGHGPTTTVAEEREHNPFLSPR